MRNLRFPLKGKDVLRLQRALAYLGYDITVDGHFGWETHRVVKTFQKSRDIEADGIVGPETRHHLFKAKHSYQPMDEPQEQKPPAATPAPPNVTPVEDPINTRFTPRTYQFRNAVVTEVHPLQLRIHDVFDKRGTANHFAADNLMTAAFIGHQTDGSTYPTSMLLSEGKIIANRQPRGYYSGPRQGKGNPTPTFIVYEDGSVAVKTINDIRPEVERGARFAVSGLGCCPETRTGFEDSIYPSVSYSTYRVGLGYNPEKNTVMLLYLNGDHGNFSSHLEALGCTMGVSTDSGGSAVYRVNGKYHRHTTRRLYAMITW